MPGIAEALSLLYGASQLSFNEQFADFHLSINYPNFARRWFRSQAVFYVDGKTPFRPLPSVQSYPFFEWGLNWCIANHSNHLFILHAAVVEKNGHAIVFPATPGSGKSTLCAGLVSRGWRLLSDEMAVIDPVTMALIPLVRPISLKNESISVIKSFAPDFEFGSIIDDTSKGTVTHVKPPANSIERYSEKSWPRWIVFPKYESLADTVLKPTSKARSVMRVAENSFNYNTLGEKGFFLACNLVDICDCYEFKYSDLADAVRLFDELSS